MCGRYNLTIGADSLQDFYDTLGGGFYKMSGPRYNIAPGQAVPVVVMHEGQRVLKSMHWGFIPHWAKDKNVGYKMINARSETAHTKPAFRVAIRKSRCLIPATGWYEWQKRADGTKQPFNIHLPHDTPFAMAGLWTHWQPEGGDPIHSCTILTTSAVKALSGLHERMPVILKPDYRAKWLDPNNTHADDLLQLMQNTETNYMAYAVSTMVNKPANDGPECVEPI
jgi:putative SOS response-associated peptidase YedK